MHVFEDRFFFLLAIILAKYNLPGFLLYIGEEIDKW